MDEEGIVRMLMMKQQELQRMREAIAQLKQLETGAEDLLRSSRATAAAPAAAAVPNGGSNDDLLQRLMAKRAQLEQMARQIALLSEHATRAQGHRAEPPASLTVTPPQPVAATVE